MKKGYSISSIRSDYGKEFKNLDFDAFCGENGISHNFSDPRNSSTKWDSGKEK